MIGSMCAVFRLYLLLRVCIIYFISSIELDKSITELRKTGGRTGRGGGRTGEPTGRVGGRTSELGGQGGGRGNRTNGSIDGVPEFSTVIAQQLQDLLPTIIAQVGNHVNNPGNNGDQNGNGVDDNIQGNVRNLNVNNDRGGC
ncbi:hypothetical protein Tco_0901230 [Tanacetum coccineum]